ncbi:hypothetical protein D9M09_11845 [Janthinobacterium agaricidamnosum]|uniref:Uncharacterized protein n=1 Tax=Janthinobacterium agaricidamnosum TaxID=55508 RepID=A0A3G2E835_9BURK|nr:hypothetical protein [Janthinobacterium agaricidamnosum]AYM76401.1 hypothetical protein D9M09_11845 [Janthinobacterium agaricidamnosum]
MSYVDDALLELDRLYWPRTIMASLSGLYRQYEEPERQINTMNQGLKTLPFISYAKIGSLFGYEKDAVAAYNDAVKLAYSCIGWEFVGLCSALVYGAPKTRRPWDEYVQSGEECLNAYFLSNEAFDDFEAYILEPARSVLAD